MEIKEKYDKTLNYIGCDDWQYKYTLSIKKSSPALNYTAFWHDVLYGYLLHKEKYIVCQYVLKILIDLIFLTMGIFRNLRKFNLVGVVFSIILYLILFFHTPFYIKNMRKSQKKTKSL